MKITVCIGSSCHLKGSRQVVEQLQALIEENHLGGEVELVGAFCFGACQTGVSVKIDETLHSLSPESVGSFFENEVLTKLQSL
ncbi:MAG: (2Fe-2S) ferredoxin domain-containing protein [Oscillospiraceae bacterium]|nr:(2Fe-2S) ferredoxin domain-containing protein [Oscillospiraceae bacterium]